jgi:hypothetical protein
MTTRPSTPVHGPWDHGFHGTEKELKAALTGFLAAEIAAIDLLVTTMNAQAAHVIAVHQTCLAISVLLGHVSSMSAARTKHMPLPSS